MPMYMGSARQRGVTREEIPRTDQGLATPEKIASCFLFLASDDLSRLVTGHILMADNGFAEFRF